MEKLNILSTEKANAKSTNLDSLSIKETLHLMNEEDAQITKAIEIVLPKIEATIELVIKSFKNNGRLLYVGAGTSGRLGILDAVECPPTFSTPHHMVQGLIAGGEGAFFKAVEGAEDSEAFGEQDLKKIQLTCHDVVVGIAASGRTPYTIGALKYANSVGAATVSLTSNKQSLLSQYANVAIEVDSGPEVLTGSTRLKAATAHKMVLNMISTVSMIKMGKVFKNYMVDVHASNYKLRERAKSIVSIVTDISIEQAEFLLIEAKFNVKLAIVMAITKLPLEEAEKLIQTSNGYICEALLVRQ